MPDIGINAGLNFVSRTVFVNSTVTQLPAINSLLVKIPIGYLNQLNYYSNYPKYLLGINVGLDIPLLPKPIGFTGEFNYVSATTRISSSVFPIDFYANYRLLGAIGLLDFVSQTSRVESNIFTLDFVQNYLPLGLVVALDFISLATQTELSLLQKLLGKSVTQNENYITFDITELPINDTTKAQYLFAGIVFNALNALENNEEIKLNVWGLKILRSRERYMVIEYQKWSEDNG